MVRPRGSCSTSCRRQQLGRGSRCWRSCWSWIAISRVLGTQVYRHWSIKGAPVCEYYRTQLNQRLQKGFWVTSLEHLHEWSLFHGLGTVFSWSSLVDFFRILRDHFYLAHCWKPSRTQVEKTWQRHPQSMQVASLVSHFKRLVQHFSRYRLFESFQVPQS